jgi:hypothetical protein
MSIFDIERIKTEIDILVQRHGWSRAENQLSLQAPDGNFHNGVGKLAGLFEENFNHINVPTDWELHRFITENRLVRTRVMLLKPKACYTLHRDLTKRVHLAVVTDPRCLFLKGREAFHIPADGVPRLIDTTEEHTAMNCTFDVERIHVVGCVTDKL